MWHLILAVAVSQGGAIEKPMAPYEVIHQVHADLVKLPLEARHNLRYLSLYNNNSFEERVKDIKALSGHCNGLSREVDSTAVAIVPNTSGTLLRINLDDYQWDTTVWEKLEDPYFSQFDTVRSGTPKTWDGKGVWDDGKSYPAGSFTYYERKKTRVLAPWLTETEESKSKLAEVLLWTKSKVPVVRADWFLYQTVIQQGRKVGYYDFLGIKNQKDFEKAIRFSEELANKLEHRRVVTFSGITLQPRRIERTNSVLGGVWRTFDNREAVDDKNPLRILDNEFKFDATEQIGPLPNGMPAFFLGNNKGERQNKAPDDIVGGDRTGQGNDTQLHINLSCIRCHFGSNKKEMGVKEVSFNKIVKLKSTDYQKYLELKRQYLRDIEGPIKVDRANYQAAIKASSGMEPFEYANQIQKIYARYDVVTPASAAAGLGITKEKMLERFRDYDTKYGLDPVLSILMGGDSIGPVQWEEVIPLAHLTIRGYKQ